MDANRFEISAIAYWPAYLFEWLFLLDGLQLDAHQFSILKQPLNLFGI